MKYEKLSKEELVEKITKFERELKTYVNNVDRRYRVFFERNLAGIYRTKLDGEILDCNDAMAQIMGYSSREELIGKNAKVLYNDLNDRRKHLELLQEKKFVKNRKMALKKKDGSVIWVSISTSEISNPKTNKIEYMEGTIIDITELIRTQEMLIKSEDNYKKMINESPYGIIIHKEGSIKYHNERANKILGIDLKEVETIKGIFPKEFVKPRLKEEGKIQHHNRVEINNAKRKVHIDIYLKQVLFENELMTEFSFVNIQDRIELEEEKLKTNVFKGLNDKLKKEIREKEKVEKELMTSLTMNIRQSAKLEAIFESSSHVMWTMDKNYRLTSFNSNLTKVLKEIYGLSPKKLDRPFIDYQMKEKDRKLWKDATDKVLSGQNMNFIYQSRNLDGKIIYLDVFLNPIYDNKEITEASGIGHDITAKVIAEYKLTESLKEKEILIKEIHHRVKNNLQVISSIFNLQSAFTEEQKIREILRESQNRIKSMAYIHESLYKSSQLGQIDFEQYVKELSKNLIHSYALKESRISLLTETESLLLDLDQAIPCGLIVNEIVSNSLKHGFPGKTDGIIAIFLKKNHSKVYLKLTDNGIGIPDNVFKKETNSLGVQLIQTLVEQIRGELSVNGSSGTAIEITFPLI